MVNELIEQATPFAIQNTLFPTNDSFRYLFKWSEHSGFGFYPFFYVVGFFICIIIASIVIVKRYKLNYDLIIWFSIIMVPTAIFGARFWSACIGDLDWANFFKFGTGGMAIQGGVLLTFIVGIIFFHFMLKRPKYHVETFDKKEKFFLQPSMWILIDTIVPLVLLGQAIGRWGNFFNGELYGQEVDPNSMLWLKNIMPGVYERMFAVVPDGVQTNGIINGKMYHPLFLYEFFLNIISFIIIYFWLPNYKKIKIGTIGMSYFVIYGIIRFSLEPLRFSTFTFVGNYVMNSLLTVVGVVGIIVCQFIAPRYRQEQVILAVWIKYIRLNLIKIGLKLNIKKAFEYKTNDKNLKNYGCKKAPNFTRDKYTMLYYGQR